MINLVSETVTHSGVCRRDQGVPRSLLQLIILLSILFCSAAHAADVLSIYDISEKQPGERVTIAGVGKGKVTVAIFQPDVEKAWKEVKVKAFHSYRTTVKLPKEVTGEYRVEVTSGQDSAATTFWVGAKLVTFREDGLMLDRWSKSKRSKVQLFVDGAPFLLDSPAVVNSGTVYIPIRPFMEYIAGTMGKKGSVITISKSVNSMTFTPGSREVIMNGTPATVTWDVLTMNRRLFLPISLIEELFGYKVEIANDNSFARIGTREKSDWWYNLPTIAESTGAKEVGAKAAWQNFGASYGTGLYGQRLSWEGAKKGHPIESHREDGRKMVTYMEALGQPRVYVAGFERDNEGNFIKLSSSEPTNAIPSGSAWGWDGDKLEQKGINYISYIGMHDAVEEEDFIKPNYTLEKTGLAMPTYPDGSIAKGRVDSALPYPISAKVYDATCAKGINGLINLDMRMFYWGENTKGLTGFKVGSPYLPKYKDLSPGEMVWPLMTLFKKDPAAPFWFSHNEAVAKRLVEYGHDGCWFDNWSPWDNFFNTNCAFGDWSEKLFNDFLAERHSKKELAALGIRSLQKFNIREYMVKKSEEHFPGEPANTTMGKEIWLEDPLWGRYKVFKMECGQKYLKHLYGAMKKAAAESGRPEGWMVCGNDVPRIDHGWVRDDWLDVVGVELSTGWSLSFGARGMMTLPRGRMSVLYKTSRAVMQGPHPQVWYYAEGEVEQKNTAKAVLSEAFANGSFIKGEFKAGSTQTVGSKEDHLWLNTFVQKEEETLKSRYYHYDIGLVHSTAEQLGNATPGSLDRGNSQLGTQGHWGFAHAMTEAHIPYQVVPDWKLTRQRLKRYSTLIYANAECVDDELLPLFEEFVENGGRLILTGPAGLRYGRKGYFQKRKKPLFSKLIGADTSEAPGNRWKLHKSSKSSSKTKKIQKGVVVWTSDPVGYTYWHKDKERTTLLPKLVELIGGTSLFDGSGLTSRTGSCLWRSGDGKKLFVDLYNVDIDGQADRVVPQGAMSFRIKIPFGTGTPSVRVVSPAGNYEPKTEMSGKWLKVEIPKLKYYASVVIYKKQRSSGGDSYLLHPDSPPKDGSQFIGLASVKEDETVVVLTAYDNELRDNKPQEVSFRLPVEAVQHLLSTQLNSRRKRCSVQYATLSKENAELDMIRRDLAAQELLNEKYNAHPVRLDNIQNRVASKNAQGVIADLVNKYKLTLKKASMDDLLLIKGEGYFRIKTTLKASELLVLVISKD